MNDRQLVLMRVLVIEDAASIRRPVVTALQEAGFAVDDAEDGEAGLALALAAPYDAVVLDVMLPKLDGLEVLKAIRAAKRATGVIILTARDALPDRVSGLDAGADDYLVKPFAIDELLARVRAVTRRGYHSTASTLKVGELELDPAARRVTWKGSVIVLSAREFALLEYVMARRGQVVTRSDILDHVYDFTAEPSSNVIDVYIGYLRRKLGDAGALIKTRRGQGYIIEETG